MLVFAQTVTYMYVKITTSHQAQKLSKVAVKTGLLVDNASTEIWSMEGFLF